MKENFEKLDGGKIEEEGKEDETSGKRIEVQSEEAPWEKPKREDEKYFIEKYRERFEIGEDSKEKINEYLFQEAEQEKFEFARKWFKEHIDELKEDGGYDVKSEDDVYIRRVVIEKGGFEELENNEEYQDTNDKIDNIYALKLELSDNAPSIQSQHLILNRLNKRGEKIGKELKEAIQKGDEVTARSKEIEFNSLFKVKKELGEKLSGKNLREEAIRERKLGLLEVKDEYVDKNVSPKLEEIEKNLNQKGEAKERVIKTLLQEIGLTKEEKGILIKKIVIKEGDEVVEKLAGKEEFDQFLKDKIKEKIENEFGKEWEEKNNERENEIDRFTEGELKKLGSTPEKAIGGIESIYDEVKKRLCDEAAKKVRGKTAKELRRIEKEFNKEGENPQEFIDNILNREGILKELTGDWGEDKSKISEFLEDYGISGSEEFLEKFDKGGEKYSEEVRKKRGFLEWLIKASFNTIEQHD